jgi:hypothetical protein
MGRLRHFYLFPATITDPKAQTGCAKFAGGLTMAVSIGTDIRIHLRGHALVISLAMSGMHQIPSQGMLLSCERKTDGARRRPVHASTLNSREP